MSRAKDIGAMVTTVLVFAILAWTLIYVFKYMGATPQVGADGKVVLDEFGNAKTILLAILPLATTAVGYWLGNKGAVAAQDDAKEANAQNAAAQAEVARVQGQLDHVRGTHPEAFTKAD